MNHDATPRTADVRPPPRGLLVRGRPTSRWLIRRWYDVRVHHAERFPATGPVVVASNHIGLADGPLLAIFAPRPVHALTKHDMFSGPLGALLQAAGQVRVDRYAPDPGAIRTCLRVLRDGGVVGVFPEGTRGTGEFERFHRGAAYLAMVTGAPILPVTFLGTREPGTSSSALPPRRSRIDLVVGHPFPVEAVPWPRNKDAVAERSLQLRAQMLAEGAAAQAETGRRLPGPPTDGVRESLPGNLLKGSP